MDKIVQDTDLLTEVEKLKTARNDALRAARAAVRDASRVNRILTVLSEPAPLDFLLEKILTTVSELFSADVVVLLDPSGSGNYYPVASVGLPEDYRMDLAPKGHIAPLFRECLSGTVLDKKMLKENPVFHELSEILGVEVAAWIPMQGNHESRGALILARCFSTPFSREEMDLLSAMAYRIALTLEQLQNKHQLEHIIKGGQKIGRQLNQSDILKASVKDFPVIIGADAAIVFRCGDLYEIDHANIPKTLNLNTPQWCHLVKELTHKTSLLQGEVVSALATSAQITSPEETADFPYRAVLAAPLFRDRKLHGILCVFRTNAIDFTLGTKQIATLYAGQISAALENAHLYGALRDELHERKIIEESLRESEERFKALVRNISDVIAVLTAEGSIKYVGEAAARSMWGQTADELIGTTLLDRAHPDDQEILFTVIETALKKPGENINTVIRMREGREESWKYFDVILTNLLHDSLVEGIVSTFHDVTDRKIFEKQLTERALFDPLTGLSNRANFLDHARIALKLAADLNTSVAIIFFDLDNFKTINDTYGHAAGDETLRTIATRLRGSLRNVDLAARLGGDEFTILIENIEDARMLKPVLDRLLAALSEPICFNDTEVKIGGSIGVAISTPHIDNPESLLRKADLAMYRAKHSGKGHYLFYDASFG